MIDFPESSGDEYKKVTIYIGGFHVTREATVVKTVLGSCISVCMYEKSLKFGGMNHFMLPEVRDVSFEDYNSTRYGIFAMEVLVNEIIKLGGKKSNIVAKVFGGGHVISSMKASVFNVADKNIEFAKKFLKSESIPIISEDIGGLSPRKVFFYTNENRILMKKLESTSKEFSLEQELRYSKTLSGKLEEKSDLTLF